MKKVFLAAGLVLSLAVIAWSAPTAADTPFGNAGASASVVDHSDALCGMPGSDANGNIIFGGIGTVGIIVDNKQKAQLTCKGENITNLSGSGQQFTGFLCGILAPSGAYLTTNSQATVSASGQATLKCTADKP